MGGRLLLLNVSRRYLHWRKEWQGQCRWVNAWIWRVLTLIHFLQAFTASAPLHPYAALSSNPHFSKGLTPCMSNPTHPFTSSIYPCTVSYASVTTYLHSLSITPSYLSAVLHIYSTLPIIYSSSSALCFLLSYVFHHCLIELRLYSTRIWLKVAAAGWSVGWLANKSDNECQ